MYEKCARKCIDINEHSAVRGGWSNGSGRPEHTITIKRRWQKPGQDVRIEDQQNRGAGLRYEVRFPA